MIEQRQRDRRGQPGRRREDWLVGLGDAPRVLIVEPHDDTRFLYILLFEEAGYAVSAVADGPSAINLVQQRLPDIVVMEFGRPGSRRIRNSPPVARDSAHRRHSGHCRDCVAAFRLPARARASGAVLVLAKPTSMDGLLSAVDEVMAVTPRERFMRRRLTRALMLIRTFARQCAPDANAQQSVRAFIDRLQVAILAVDEHGRYVAVSRGASMLTGYSCTELLRMSVFDTAFGANLPLAQPWQDAQAHGGSIADTAIRDASGKTVNIHTTFDLDFLEPARGRARGRLRAARASRGCRSR